MSNFFSPFLSFLPFSSSFSKKRIYLDYASVTPVDPQVIKHVSKISKEYSANPSSLYKEGVQAENKLEEARTIVAKHIEAHADEIVFTSGGTESNNLAIQGVLKAFLKNSTVSSIQNAQDSRALQIVKPHIISSMIEHPSVRELLLQYQKEEICDVTFLSVNSEGIVDLKELKKSLRAETILVSIMYVNNEIGTIQPIAEISKIVRHYKKERAEKERAEKENSKGISQSNTFTYSSVYPLVHTDACQAVLFCPLRVPTLGVDMMTLDSAKFYGPRGVGALYVKRSLKLDAYGQSKTILPIQIGGSQEFELRAGTQNVAGISGFAYAFDLAVKERERESIRLCKLRDFLVDEIKKAVISGKISHVIFNGSYGTDPYKNPMRVPNNLNICVPGMDAEYAVLRLDVRGVCVSSVTSCRSKNDDSSSYVVEALYSGNADASSSSAQTDVVNGSKSERLQDCGKSSLRITLGRLTTSRDIKKVSKVLIQILTRVI